MGGLVFALDGLGGDLPSTHGDDEQCFGSFECDVVESEKERDEDVDVGGLVLGRLVSRCRPKFLVAGC